MQVGFVVIALAGVASILALAKPIVDYTINTFPNAENQASVTSYLRDTFPE
jgi:hypothetical protein